MSEPLRALSGRGSCWWLDCPNEADYSFFCNLTPPALGKTIYDVKVEVCRGHLDISKRLGRISLDWDRVLKMVGEMEEEECEDCPK